MRIKRNKLSFDCFDEPLKKKKKNKSKNFENIIFKLYNHVLNLFTHTPTHPHSSASILFFHLFHLIGLV